MSSLVAKISRIQNQKSWPVLVPRSRQEVDSTSDDQICSNGKAVIEQPDGKLWLLDIDTPTRKIVRYELDIDAGKVSNEVTAVDLASATVFLTA